MSTPFHWCEVIWDGVHQNMWLSLAEQDQLELDGYKVKQLPLPVPVTTYEIAEEIRYQRDKKREPVSYDDILDIALIPKIVMSDETINQTK